MEEIKKAKTGAIWAYGLCLFVWGLLFAMNTSYWAYFMTDVAQMPTLVMAKTLLVANICDWIMVPVAAVLMQKLYPRVQYRKWLLIAPIVVAACFIVMFMPNSLPIGTKAVLYGGAYCFQTVFQSLMFGSLNTIVPLLGKRQEDRVAFSSKKAQGNQLGKVVFGLITLPLILLINGGVKEGAAGFFTMTIIYGVLFVGGFAYMYFAAKEADAEAVNLKKEAHPPILDMFKILFTNQHFLSVIGADSCRYTAQFVVWSLSVYYFKYVLGNMAMLTVFFTTMSIIGFCGAVVGEFLGKKIDKRKVYMAGFAVLALAHLVNFFVAPVASTYIVLISIGYFGMGWSNANAIALTSDGAVYSEWKSGKEVKGFMMTISMIVPKIANIIVGSIVGFGLASIGYVANTDMTPETVSGMIKLVNLVPIGFLVLGILLILFINKLSPAKMNEIQLELQAKRVS